jgi:hypothetical protein
LVVLKPAVGSNFPSLTQRHGFLLGPEYDFFWQWIVVAVKGIAAVKVITDGGFPAVDLFLDIAG